MTEPEAKRLFEKWRDRLHLEAWDIRFEWKVRQRDMYVDESCGCTRYEHSTRQAVIQILDEVDTDGVFEFSFDYERILVHELLHIKFSDLEDSGNELRDKLLHQLVDDMAKVLVGVERGE